MSQANTINLNDCWLYAGYINSYGYGVVYFGGTAILAHRAAYESWAGAIPKGLQIDHLCRTRSCINPQHLEPVTRHENILRGESIIAKNARKITCKRGHPLDGKTCYGYRRCLTCHRLWYHQHKQVA